jgi:NADP-dependent 3-hydroxy acid dehydrogenase YdfG
MNAVSHIDIIINNAGIMPCHPFLNHSIQEIDRCIDINVKGCIWVRYLEMCGAVTSIVCCIDV